ncbi:DUF4124 domain-containing protein [Sulfurirhabdus autotrophica]|uniref:Uncharacterized protein DUF4124 n=1 Tax=Sulfurirhabdus autotrophica TaxID=1706046 RepID=A0A4R3Y922_9PROT|nr:DUF4124 domain-containing protein [Sulfurirhabdus autotrophica]TCV88182.1 uncharacterized protein DUF4124 [Sulfurirhabdus autotrophica]
MRYLTAIMVALLISQPASAKMFKWVDEKGATHYGDSIPPQYSNQGNIELNKRGMVIKKTDGALTQEQLDAKAATAEKEKQDAHAALEQKRKDTALLNSYSNEKEIDMARDRNLMQVDTAIQGTQTRIKSEQVKLDELRKKAESIQKNKKPVPPYLADEIKQNEQSIKTLNDSIKANQLEKETIRTKYEAEKQHFHELKKLSTAP